MKKFIVWLIVISVLVLVAWFAWRAMSGNITNDTTSTTQQNFQDQSAIENDQIDTVDDPFLGAPVVEFDDLAKEIKSEYKADPEFQFCANEVVQGCLAQVISKKVAETGDLAFCDDFLTSEGVESCRVAQSYSLAREQKNTSFCDVLNEQQKLGCLNEVVALQAFDAQDLSRCDELAEGREQCVDGAASRLAIETKDAKWCESVGEDQREFCVQEIAFQLEEQKLLQEAEAEFEQQRIADEAQQAETVEAIEQVEESLADEEVPIDADVVEEDLILEPEPTP